MMSLALLLIPSFLQGDRNEKVNSLPIPPDLYSKFSTVEIPGTRSSIVVTLSHWRCTVEAPLEYAAMSLKRESNTRPIRVEFEWASRIDGETACVAGTVMHITRLL